MNNLFDSLPEDHNQEHFENLLQTSGFVLERIVSYGQATPKGEWLDQDKDEWVILLKGEAGLSIENEDGVRTLKVGDYLHIPAHQRHRVEWTASDAETVWLAVHYPNTE